jgi:amidohydrolase
MLKEIINWRRDFHKHPELEFDVHRSANIISDLLRSFDLKVYEKIGKTGVVGVLSQGSSDRAIGLRADMDALPLHEKNDFEHRSIYDNKMHACGHDGHMAMLLGAAKQLSHTREFDGTVYFIFQPNEERGLGAQQMIDDGLFEKFPMQAVYGMHNMPGIDTGKICLRSGAIMGAEDNFLIKIKGVGGHSSTPHKCIDPIVIGTNIVNALQTIPSRMIDPLESVVVSVTDFKTDGSTNIIASEVEITGDCRCFHESVQDAVAESMQSIVSSICKAYGAEYEFEYKKLFYPTINTHQEYLAAAKAAIAVNGIEDVDTDCAPITASEDFSSMLRVKPGAYVLIGNGKHSSGGCMLHNAHYEFNDDVLATGMQYWVKLVEQELIAKRETA